MENNNNNNNNNNNKKKKKKTRKATPFTYYQMSERKEVAKNLKEMIKQTYIT
jgi:hypothetical protein